MTPWVTILFLNSNGKSTIDYMLSSIDLFHDIQYFNIQPPNELSDHCIVSTGIFSDFENIATNGEHHNTIPGKYLWTEEAGELYTLALLNDE